MNNEQYVLSNCNGLEKEREITFKRVEINYM